MVSRAFSCLGDASKKAKYDQFGSEEPAGGFGNGVRYRRNANRPMHFEGDISPEDLFNMFFNGGFDGVQFNTRFGAGYGGPVFVQTFGQPFGRRTNRQAEKPVGWIAILLQVIPFIIIAILMLLINFLQPSPEPMNSWEAVSKHVSLSMTRSHPNPSVTTYKKIPYWTSNEFKGYFSRGNGKELRVYEDAVERQFLTVMQKKCQEEQIDLQRRKVEASNDLEEMERLQKEKCPSCEKLHMYSV